MSLLECVEVGATAPDWLVIWLHGLGADGHDFEPIVAEMQLPASLHMRFVFPHAPQRAVTINAGVSMRAWYDIVSAQIEQHEDETGIRQSQQQIEALIHHHIEQGIDSRHIILAGFSQGGAIALQTGLRSPLPLGGILALSTYLPLVNSFEEEITAQNRHIPILLAHGKFDPIVPYRLAEDTRYFLERAGYQVEWHDYPMQHQVSLDEIRDIRDWFLRLTSE